MEHFNRIAFIRYNVDCGNGSDNSDICCCGFYNVS